MDQWLNPKSAMWSMKTIAKFNSLVCHIAGFDDKTSRSMIEKSPLPPDFEQYLSRKAWIIYILKFMEMWTNVLKNTLKELEQCEKTKQDAVVD